jgi:hypothetical protein
MGTSEELMTRATGKALDASAFFHHHAGIVVVAVWVNE